MTSVAQIFLSSKQRTEIFLAISLVLALIWIECFFVKLVFQRRILFQGYLISFAVFYVIPFCFIFLFSLNALTA
jgi:hypothetical protein